MKGANETIDGPSVDVFGQLEWKEVWRASIARFAKGVMLIQVAASADLAVGEDLYSHLSRAEVRVILYTGAVRTIELVSVTGNFQGVVEYEFDHGDTLVVEARQAPDVVTDTDVGARVVVRATVQGELRA